MRRPNRSLERVPGCIRIFETCKIKEGNNCKKPEENQNPADTCRSIAEGFIVADPRIVRHAEVLVDHSLKVQPGQKILISGTSSAAPLIRECYRLILQRGALPIHSISVPGMERIFYEWANEQQLSYVEPTKMLFELADGMINILSQENTKELTQADPAKVSLVRKARQPLTQYLMQGGLKWVLTLFPTNAYAQEAEMSLEEYEQFVYDAVNIDYDELHRSMAAAAEQFNRASKVRIVGKDTDLTVDIAGRSAVLCSGEHNVPDGEFFFTPNHLLTEGHIYFEWPTVFSGREISGIRLEFEKGKIVRFSAEKGGEFLEKILNTDEGSRYLGELGIGANFGITRPTKDILFDEKIGGSIHLAVGRAYEEAGAGNESAIHWDMVKSLKDGGEIYLDGRLVQKNGKWVF